VTAVPAPRKVIASPADLAINGAPPAFAEPLLVGRPNIGDAAAFHRYVDDMFGRRWLSNNGPYVQELERRIAEFLGVRHCIAVCNATIGMEVVIRALELTGEIIVPSYTFIATAHVVSWMGLTPVFADIDPATHNLDVESVRAAITPRTSAIFPVHLWGRPAPVEALEAVGAEHGIPVFYDAAHAFGCSHRGRMVGNFGACEVFSFHATKFFNTFEGGAITTNDDALADRMRRMINFGFAGLDNVVDAGTNAKMTEPCAAIGLVNFDALDSVVRINASHLDAYARGLSGIDGISLLQRPRDERTNAQYIVTEVRPAGRWTRDSVLGALRAEGVEARRYFWPGIHRMPAYAGRPEAVQLPATEAVAEAVIVLPTGTGVGEPDVQLVCEIIRSVHQTHR
jgi:dTDP-4-amino-4,6-dideoxygalactose transaminase